MEYTPWAPDRPFDGGGVVWFNCMTVRVRDFFVFGLVSIMIRFHRWFWRTLIQARPELELPTSTSWTRNARILVTSIVVSVKFLLLLSKWGSGDSANSPCLTGLLNWHYVIFTDITETFLILNDICICFNCTWFFIVGTSRMYSYIINEEGLPMFVGTHSSVIFYNQSMSSWVWWAQKPKNAMIFLV